jgi:hypothetical protein
MNANLANNVYVNGNWYGGNASGSGGVIHQNPISSNWHFPPFNSGGFYGPCSFPNAMCCSGEWGPYLSEPAVAIANINNFNQLHLVFLQETALSDSTIPIPIDFFVGSEASHSLGYDTIIVDQGDYLVNFSNYPQYGEVTFNTRLVRSHSMLTTLSLEGFYNLSTNQLNMRDTVRAYLRNTNSPLCYSGFCKQI